MPSGCGHRWRRLLADLGRGGGPAARAQRIGPGAGRAPTPPRSGDRGTADDAAARSARDHGSRRRPFVGRRAPTLRAPVARRPILAPAIELATRRLPGLGRLRSPPSKRPRRSSRTAIGPSGRVLQRSTGRTVGPGDPASGFACPALAATLETLAREGFDAFYDGDLADRQARGLARRRARRSTDVRSRRASLRLGRADLDRLSRRPGDDPPTKQLGRRAPSSCSRSWAGSKPPSADGLRPGRRDRPGLDPPRDRGGEARHGRPRRRT